MSELIQKIHHVLEHDSWLAVFAFHEEPHYIVRALSDRGLVSTKKVVTEYGNPSEPDFDASEWDHTPEGIPYKSSFSKHEFESHLMGFVNIPRLGFVPAEDNSLLAPYGYIFVGYFHPQASTWEFEAAGSDGSSGVYVSSELDNLTNEAADIGQRVWGTPLPPDETDLEDKSIITDEGA